MQHVEHPVPAGFCKEMGNDVENEASSIRQGSALVLVRRSLERPVNEQRPSDDICLRYKSPVAAVQAVGPVITHSKIAVLGNHQITILNVAAHDHGPFRSHAKNSGG